MSKIILEEKLFLPHNRCRKDFKYLFRGCEKASLHDQHLIIDPPVSTSSSRRLSNKIVESFSEFRNGYYDATLFNITLRRGIFSEYVYVAGWLSTKLEYPLFHAVCPALWSAFNPTFCRSRHALFSTDHFLTQSIPFPYKTGFLAKAFCFKALRTVEPYLVTEQLR